MVVYDAIPHVSAQPRPREVFESFDDEHCRDRWTIEGEAFSGFPKPNVHGQTLLGFTPPGLADSFKDASDRATGKLVSRPFTIDRRFITFLIAGGNHPGETCVNLLVGGKIVRTAVGDCSEVLKPAIWIVDDLQGKTATIEIVDNSSGDWGHILVDQIEFADEATSAFETAHDYGNLCFQMIADGARLGASPAANSQEFPDAAFLNSEKTGVETRFDQANPLIGSLNASFTLHPGASQAVTCIVSWYFPNPLNLGLKTDNRRGYVSRFASARDVADSLRAKLGYLIDTTRLWRDTWYDSTLPYWFLDRTFLNTSILATNTSYLQTDGRFYGYEGVYSCQGTCTHVWSYAQAIGRVFPEIERRIRDRDDLGIALDHTGEIHNRGEFGDQMCVDGQCGTILRAFRDYQMSPDDAYLHLIYPRVMRALQYMMGVNDPEGTGMLTGKQANTLDGEWYGRIAWLSGYYQAALRAAAVMADDMDQPDQANRLRGIADRGRDYMDAHLFNGEYYFQERDPDHAEAPGSYLGCEYSQLLGQSWAYQVGLGPILDPDKVTTALHSLWKYNVTTDVGLYRKQFTAGRWYAMPGEGGMIGCTFPNGGSEAVTKNGNWQQSYMNECQAGYEYGATSLMMWHGLVDQAMAHTRLLHDRYDGARRNPWNECECGSHYSRSMASYGLFTGACGYEYFGPHGRIAFAPRLSPENFKAAFTSAQGWGSFSQRYDGLTFSAALDVRWGQLGIRTIGLQVPPGMMGMKAEVTLAGQPLNCEMRRVDGKQVIALPSEAMIGPGRPLSIVIH